MNAFDRLMSAKNATPSSTWTYSSEQQAIAQALLTPSNVIVDAVAGSGKTTTLGLLIQTLKHARPNERAVVIVYNRSLKDETQARLPGALVYTVHGAAGALFSQACPDDETLDGLVNGPPPDETRFPPATVLLVDETQDMIPLYVRFLRLLIRTLGIRQMVCLGDTHQAIYAHKGADARFLTRAPEVFGDVLYRSDPWVTLPLSTTYRCPPPVTRFINQALLGEPRLTPFNAQGQGEVVYHVLSQRDAIASMVHRIQGFLSGPRKRKPEDMVILMPILVAGQPYAPSSALLNALSHAGISVAVSSDTLTETTLAGKLLLSTIHKFKGRERPIVFLFGFDDSAYYKLRETYSEVPIACDALRYVSATRSREKLFVYQDADAGAFRWLDLDAVVQTSEVVLGEGRRVAHAPLPDVSVLEDILSVRVTELVKHVPHETAKRVLSLLTIETLTDPIEPGIPILTEVVFEGGKAEDVASVYGTAIPMLKEKALTGRADVARVLKTELDRSTGALRHTLQGHLVRERALIQAFSNPKETDIPLEDAMRMANLHRAVADQFLFRLHQIPHYDWIDREAFQQCLDRLAFLTPADTFEVPVTVFVELEPTPDRAKRWHVEVRGAFDCLHFTPDKTVIPYEFKIVNSLTTDHRLQVAAYLAMATLDLDRAGLPLPGDYRLLNCRTGHLQKFALKRPDEALDVLRLLCENKVKAQTLRPWDEVMAEVT